MVALAIAHARCAALAEKEAASSALEADSASEADPLGDELNMPAGGFQIRASRYA